MHIATLLLTMHALRAPQLADPGVQAACFRALKDSATFNELLKRGPAALPPPPPTRIYLAPGTAAELGLREEVGRLGSRF